MGEAAAEQGEGEEAEDDGAVKEGNEEVPPAGACHECTDCIRGT